MTNTPMTDERLAELRAIRTDIRRQPYKMYGLSYQEDIADAVDEIDRLRAENERLRMAVAQAKHLVKALRQMVVAADEAGRVFVHVELAEGGKLVLRATDKFLDEEGHGPQLNGDTLTCEGCGVAEASGFDADGIHLCRECGLAALGDA